MEKNKHKTRGGNWKRATNRYAKVGTFWRVEGHPWTKRGWSTEVYYMFHALKLYSQIKTKKIKRALFSCVSFRVRTRLESPWNLLQILSNKALQVSETKIGQLSTLSTLCGITLAWCCPFWSPWKIEKCVLERPWKVLEFLFEKSVRTLIFV